MTTPFWCLAIGCLIPYVLAGTGGYLRGKQFGSLDNKNPRKQQAEATGAAARAVAAQANAWEALALFAPAVLVAHLAGADAGLSATFSLVWLAARVLHPIAYLADQDVLRSLTFLGGFICVVALFWLAAAA